MSIAITLAEVVEEVSAAFQRYEQVLVGNNVAGMRTEALGRVVCAHLSLSLTR
jgi:hypothetical protein